jgi:hypothetical protein
MTMVTDISHFLDDDGEIPDLPPEAADLLSFLGAVIEVATLTYGSPMTLSDIGQHHPTVGEACNGQLEVLVHAETNAIGWECVECGENGVISNWQGTLWDRRTYTRH